MTSSNITLPSFISTRLRRRDKTVQPGVVEDSYAATAGSTSTPYPSFKPSDIEKATHARRVAIIISSLCFLVSFIFLLLTIIGNINDKPVIRDTYFLKLDISDIYPQAFNSDNIVFVNSIARSLGLHDFYQVGLWSYCEGYEDEGITHCSPPVNMYWFNPVAIILDELLAGATISLPTNVVSTLSLVKDASNVMFGFFITGLILSFFCVFITPVVIYSHWWSLPMSILTFATALMITIASVVATIMFSIFKNVLTSQPGLNISANLGLQMMVFMWIGAGGSLIGCFIQLCLSCCFESRRDFILGRRVGCCSCARSARRKNSEAGGNKHAHVLADPVNVAEEEKKGAGRRRVVGVGRVKEEVPEVQDS